MKTLDEIRKEFKEKPQQASADVNILLKNKKTREGLILRAEIYEALTKNTDAINDYIEILKLYGKDEEIENRKKFLETIVSMTQLDIYACTNLHNDPWD